MKPMLRPRRRPMAATATATDAATGDQEAAAGRASPDSEEVRQSAAVLEMMASKSQSRSNEDERNQKLSEVIASVIHNSPQQPQGKMLKKTQRKPTAATPQRKSARKPAPKKSLGDSPSNKIRLRRTIDHPQADQPLRRSTRRRRTKTTVEVTVTASDSEEGVDEAEIAADFFSRQNSADYDDDMDDYAVSEVTVGMNALVIPQAPRFYEMTPQLLEQLMAPVGLYQSPSEDGTEKELRLRMPVDFGGGFVGVCDILFNEHLGVRIDGATDWMPVRFIGDYLDPESIQISDTAFTDVDETLGYASKPVRSSGRQDARDSTLAHGGNGLRCKEGFDRIAAVLDMNAWMQIVIEKSTASTWLHEHDYAEPMMKFGKPRSASILQEAVAAFNKYVNFIRLSERREPFLFGLFWEKEDNQTDYWLLPRPPEEDEEYDRRHAMMIIPIANEWTEEVVVSSEETVDPSGLNGAVTPMTFWDNRGFLSLASLSGGPDDTDYSGADSALNTTAEDSYFKKKESTGKKLPRKRTTATPVARAPRFLAPKLDPRAALAFDGKLNENGMPESLDEIVKSVENQARLGGDPTAGMSGSAAAYYNARAASRVVTASGHNLKNMSKEKLEEIDFAMRCIKELQQRRYTGACRLHCRICEREFTAPTSLIVHYRSHAGIKPFTCPICLTSFTRRHSLKYHMLCHSGQARFRCSMCDRLFRHSGHYRDHMRKHEHGKPFSCVECNRNFATRTTFRRHMQVVHNSSEGQKGKARSVGVSKLYAEMEGLDDLEAGELGEVAEEIEYEDDDDEMDDLDNFVAGEIVRG